MRLVVHKVQLKALTVYVCQECGREGLGNSVTLDFNVDMAAEDLGNLASQAHQQTSNSHMPVGWACYGRSHHKCPECKS